MLHRTQELMWNLLSWNLTPKEGGILAKVVPKHEHSDYVDPVVSISTGETKFKN